MDDGESSRSLESLGDRHGVAGQRAPLPGPLPRLAEHHLAVVAACRGVDEDPLNRDKPSDLADADQQRRPEDGVRLGAERASRVVAEIGHEMARRGEFADADTLTPIYIRRPEPEEKWEERQKGK